MVHSASSLLGMQLTQLPPTMASRVPTPAPPTPLLSTATASSALPTPSGLPAGAQHANPRRYSHEFVPAMQQPHHHHHHRPSPMSSLAAHQQQMQQMQMNYGATKPPSRPGSAGAHHHHPIAAADAAATAVAAVPTSTNQPGLYAAPEMEFLHSPTGAGALPLPDPTAHLLGYHFGEEPHSEFLV